MTDAEAQDQLQHGWVTGGGESLEQKLGQGLEEDVATTVLHKAVGCSDGDGWSRIAQEHTHKKQKRRRSNSRSAEKATVATSVASRKQRFRPTISDHSCRRVQMRRRVTTRKTQPRDMDGKGIENKVPYRQPP